MSLRTNRSELQNDSRLIIISSVEGKEMPAFGQSSQPERFQTLS